MSPFVILALPRSRTAWLSAFLSYRDWQCGHDELRHCRSLEDVSCWLGQPCTGTVETLAAPFWRLLPRLRPDVRIVVVRRPVAEVVASLMRLGIGFDEQMLRAQMGRLDRKLDQIERRLPVYSVAYDDLSSEATCAALFEHCLPYPHDHDWWAHCAARNVQINMPLLIRYMHAHREQMGKLAQMAQQRILQAMHIRPVAEAGGMTLQTEAFDDFYRDGEALFRNHLVSVGEAPDRSGVKNLALFRAIERVGCLQVVTGRVNGRMFGYLMSIISPSLEDSRETIACHTFFYAELPGLGMKLQRAALASLKARGVNEVYFRAGPRGAGPRMGALYRRLGAYPDGEQYRLRMET